MAATYANTPEADAEVLPVFALWLATAERLEESQQQVQTLLAELGAPVGN